MELTGAGILLEGLKREGVEIIFGYPGGAIIDIYDELSRADLKHILVRHEQSAVHAADGYARASGKVGVCLVTSGPGVTNAVTGIATANADSIPLVVITGQVSSHLIGNDAFQEVDTVGITRPCTKHNYLVRDISSLPAIISQAFYLARSGRPGPVLVDLPKNVIVGKTDCVWPESVQMRSYNPNYIPNVSQLRKVADLLAKAEKPVFLIGGGVILSNAYAELTQLAELTSTPVVSTLMGLGGYPGNGRLWKGMAGMHGEFAANKALTEADFILAVGTRFSDRTTGRLDTFAPDAEIVHIDIDPTSIRKNVQVDVPLVADCRLALKELSVIVRERYGDRDWTGTRLSWNEFLERTRRDCPLRYARTEEIKPQQVMECINRLTGGEAILTTEVGQHQMWAAQFFHCTRPRAFITSGGLGAMGYGLPAAIGAQLASPGKLVIDIAGDGSIQMNIHELATVVQNRLPIKIIIFNNRYLGMVRQWQELFYAKNYSCTDMSAQPDFVKLAEAYGVEGYRASRPEELEATLDRAFKSSGPVLVDVNIRREENVMPMVPSGASLDKVLLAEEQI
ncbi:MAG: biosynthetic-type acetolactate synthase large subunit [Deltaproteobacteria bacterium]|jgi:acetolactate synthase-1/2/3 large subunit|nr:biosynthetic-type acetolactate synthase large subunit [Deltaproteobacteria bacterium]